MPDPGSGIDSSNHKDCHKRKPGEEG